MTMPDGFKTYRNEWLVQVWRPPTVAEKAAGIKQPRCFHAYFTNPPVGVPSVVYADRDAASKAALADALTDWE